VISTSAALTSSEQADRLAHALGANQSAAVTFEAGTAFGELEACVRYAAVIQTRAPVASDVIQNKNKTVKHEIIPTGFKKRIVRSLWTFTACDLFNLIFRLGLIMPHTSDDSLFAYRFKQEDT